MLYLCDGGISDLNVVLGGEILEHLCCELPPVVDDDLVVDP